eukprot:CAMPEP_0176444926 /NCGR_PEP_ID=MMETSP0127-20121128/23367_1 /TAXON_ID=938130 /ORGANISM="Platyophrya macrostoma, Strain WH" /LENGTH=137 /DNA_ID=CAMNT_0017830555 /DNA_START=125 /DNA_END=539 /DNA_ORIENTATION=-
MNITPNSNIVNTFGTQNVLDVCVNVIKPAQIVGQEMFVEAPRAFYNYNTFSEECFEKRFTERVSQTPQVKAATMSPSFGPTPAPPIRPDFALWGSFKLFRMSSLSSSESSATVSRNLPSAGVSTPPEFASGAIIEVG